MRRLTRLLAVLAIPLSPGCMPAEQGASATGGDKPPAFEIVEQSPRALVVDAAGARVTIAPPEGVCIETSALRDEHASLFLALAECPEVKQTGMVATLSVGAQPMFGKNRGAAMDELAAFLDTPAGRKGAGMSGDPDKVKILATRRADDTLYVLVEDNGARTPDAFGPRFWRAFTDIKGRAVIASLGIAGKKKTRDSDVLLQLSRIVTAVQRANGEDGAAAESSPEPASKPAPPKKPAPAV